MDPLTVATIFKGGSALLGLFGKKKKAKEQDAYANTSGQADTDYANAQTNYNTVISNQQSQQSERSRAARAALKSSLLRSLGPNIIGQDALPALERDAAYSPVDYSGAPQRTYVQKPSSSTGLVYDTLSGAADAVAQGQASAVQAADYDRQMQDYQFQLRSGGRKPLDYSKLLQQAFGW